MERIRHPRPAPKFDGDAYRMPAYAYETKDCTVRALSVWAGITYAEAHALASAAGRPDRKGWYPHEFLDTLGKRLQVNPDLPTYAGRRLPSRMTVGRFAKENPRGRFYCVVRGHALAIVDGAIIDWRPSPARILLTAWEF